MTKREISNFTYLVLLLAAIGLVLCSVLKAFSPLPNVEVARTITIEHGPLEFVDPADKPDSAVSPCDCVRDCWTDGR